MSKTLTYFYLLHIHLLTSPYLTQGNYPFYHLPPHTTQCKTPHPSPLPIIIFPGLNDWCGGVDYFLTGLNLHTQNKSHCVEYGKNISGVFTHMRKLIKKACENLQVHKELVKNGMIVIGLSMGGLIARGVVQECDLGVYARRLITVGTPQMGVSKVPSYDDTFLEMVFGKIAIWIIYRDFIQRFLSGGNFFRCPWKFEQYLKSDNYIKVLNNEEFVVERFRDRIRNLEVFVNFAFREESYLYPKESVHWGYFEMKEPFEMKGYKDTVIYKEDRIGIRHLDETGRLKFEFFGGNHSDGKIFELNCVEKLLYYLV